jgi:hypothetical protein
MRLQALDSKRDVTNATASDIQRVLTEGSFGDFVILGDYQDGFIQAGPGCPLTDEYEAFERRTGSDPWTLECYQSDSGQMFRVEGYVTSDQVRQALLSYLAGGADWRNFVWNEFQL